MTHSSASATPVVRTIEGEVREEPTSVEVAVRHYGGAREVGATSYLVSAMGVRILVDAGARPRSPRGSLTGESLSETDDELSLDTAAEAHAAGDTDVPPPVPAVDGVVDPVDELYPDYSDLPEPDVMLLTHGHFDHVGALPLVLKRFPDVPVYATPETRAITRLLLVDGVQIAQRRIAEAQAREAAGEPPITPGVSVEPASPVAGRAAHPNPDRGRRGASAREHDGPPRESDEGRAGSGRDASGRHRPGRDESGRAGQGREGSGRGNGGSANARRGGRRGGKPSRPAGRATGGVLAPPFTEAQATEAASSILPMPVGRTLVREVRGVVVEITAVAAGHIPGAVSYQVRLVRPGESEIRLALLGDVSDDVVMTVDPLDFPAHIGFRPHVVVSESTYGATSDDFRPIAEERTRLRRYLVDTWRRGGHSIIPAFAIGRAQEVAFLVGEWNATYERWCRDNDRDPAILADPDDPALAAALVAMPMLPGIPCIVGGMARAVTEVLELNPDSLSSIVRDRFAARGDVIFARRHGVVPARASEKEMAARRPCIIIAPSGMLAGGSVLNWIKDYGEDPRTAILFSGYQDCESPGGRLLTLESTSGAPGEEDAIVPRVLTVDRERYIIAGPVRAFRLRAHLDAGGLARVVAGLAPQHAILAHGSPDACSALRDRIAPFAPSTALHIPDNGEHLVLDVRADAPTLGAADVVRVRAQTSTARLMHGATPSDVYQAMQRSPRARHTLERLALAVFGVPANRAERDTARRLVAEVLDVYENVWFTRAPANGWATWSLLRASWQPQLMDGAAPTGGAGQSGPVSDEGALGPADLPPTQPGVAIVRHLRHHPRLALIGAVDERGYHPAIVAMARAHRVHKNDVLALIRPHDLPDEAWNHGLHWADRFRAMLTEEQLAAERLLRKERRALLERAGREGGRAAAFRRAWNAIAIPSDPQPPSPGAVSILQELRERAVASGALDPAGDDDASRPGDVVTLRLREAVVPLGERYASLLAPDPYGVGVAHSQRSGRDDTGDAVANAILALRMLLSEVRYHLGLPTAPDGREVLAGVGSVSSLPPALTFDLRPTLVRVRESMRAGAVPDDRGASVPLDPLERYAVHLHNARVALAAALTSRDESGDPGAVDDDDRLPAWGQSDRTDPTTLPTRPPAGPGRTPPRH